jgi:long-chain acyl-CoA synthetase
MRSDLKLNDVPPIASVQEMVLHSARTFGEKIALEDLKETPIPKLTFAGLLRHILKFGTALRRLGLKEGSHIAVIGENRVQWSLSYLTGMCFKYVLCPIDKGLTINEVLNILHESDAVGVIYSDAFEPILEERRTSMKKLKYYINMDLPAKKGKTLSMVELIERSVGCEVDDLPCIDPEALAEIIFTSGSLGRAKGVMLSQRNIAANLMAMTSMLAVFPTDRFLSILPMHHSYECTCGMLCPLYMGASVHYARSLKTVVEDLQASHATMLLGVPLLYDKMFKRIYKSIQEKKLVAVLMGPLIKATDLMERVGWKGSKRAVFKEIHERFGGHIRVFIAGGAAQDPMVARGLREFGFNFVQGYGLTETSPILALNRLDAFKDDAAGMPLPGVTLRIHDPNHDGVGEIWAKGANIMMGYYKNPEATGNTFEDGWFKTGDLGFRDEDGFLHIAGRKKNVIISKRGENVYPEEIEDLLKRSPFILECMVYGEEDQKHGEVIAALILPDAEAFIELSETKDIPITNELMKETVAKEIAKVNRQVSSYKQIVRFHLRDREFEKTTTQKVKRYLVKKD